ncbi:MAG: cytochrome c [Mariniblastus sp.]|nr:cytochrome c [Mariniblastus sp.]
MMCRILIITTTLLATTFAGHSGAYAYQDAPATPPTLIQRAKRPNFTEREWNGIYFENLFRDALVGNRPEPQASAAMTQNGPSAPNTVDKPSNPENASAFSWSDHIDSTVIEDEVKTLQQRLVADITTPGRFKSDYGKIHHSYSMLSMLFGIVYEYDKDVRWKELSAVAQPAFARAAANSRVGSLQAYNNAKLQRDNLTEMVRGGRFNDNEKSIEAIDWPSAVNRSPMMLQLETTLGILKPHLSNQTEFTQNSETIYHGANLISAMGQVLCQTDMEAADEEDYAAYAQEMSAAAQKVIEGTKTNNYDLASEGFNLIEQSCSNCHDEWR